MMLINANESKVLHLFLILPEFYSPFLGLSISTRVILVSAIMQMLEICDDAMKHKVFFFVAVIKCKKRIILFSEEAVR